MPPQLMFWEDVIIPLAGMAMIVLVSWPIVRAVARHFERRHEARMASMGGGDVEGLRADVGQLRSQVESLEERLDFTERMLTQERTRRQEALPRGEG